MTVDTSILSRAGSPWCLSLTGSAQDLTSQIYEWVHAGLTVRALRGRKMLTYDSLFDEVAAALQFPWYFGENSNAFDECITDLSWLPPQAGYVFAISEPVKVLRDTDDDGLSWFIGSVGRAAAEWGRPVEQGQPWDRPAIPFHMVLQVAKGDDEQVIALWESRGASIAVPG